MNPGKRLHDLQEIDLDLGKKGERLAHLERELSYNQELEEAKAQLEAEHKHLAELEAKEREIEWAAEDLRAKLNPLQEKLYAGSVKNPKELAGLQQQVEKLRGQVRQEEDKALEILVQVEATEEEITRQSAEAKNLDEEWQKKREQLLGEQAELASAVDAISKRRGQMVATLDPVHVGLYEELRGKKQGYAIARIEQGRCQGCRITLSMSDMTRARTAEIVQCDSCSRILYLG